MPKDHQWDGVFLTDDGAFGVCTRAAKFAL